MVINYFHSLCYIQSVLFSTTKHDNDDEKDSTSNDNNTLDSSASNQHNIVDANVIPSEGGCMDVCIINEYKRGL